MAITPRTTAVFELSNSTTLGVNTNTGSVGDYVVLSVATDGTAISTPNGWSIIVPEIDQVVNCEVFGRFLTGGADDNPTLSSTGATRFSALVQPFGGVDTTTPMDATAVTTNGSSTSSLSPPAITTVTAGAYAVSGVAIDASGEVNRFTVSGTGWSESAQTTGVSRRQAAAIKSMPSAGSSGQATFTQSGGALWTVGWTIALRPSSGGGGGSDPLDITYVGSGAWAAGAASPSALNPTGLADGDKLYAVVHSRESTTSLPATVGVWTKAHEQAIGSGTVGAGTGPTRFTIYEADATASMSGAAAGLTSLGTTASLVRVHAFRAPAGATGLTWSRAFASYSHASSTNIGGTTSSSIALAAKDMLLVAHGSPDDTTTSLPLTSVSATGLTFGTITGGAVQTSGTGNDHAAASYVVPVTAGSGTSTVTLAGTANAAETGGSIVLRIRLAGTVATSPPVASAGADASVAVNTAFTRTGTGTNTPTSYAWTIQAGPTDVGTTIGTAAALNWTPTVAGTYTLRFSATNAGGTGTDDLTLTVTSDIPYVIRSAEVSCSAGATANPGTLSQGATAGNLLVYALAGDKNTGTLTVTDNIGNNGGANPWSEPIEVPGASVSTYMAWKVAVGGETTVTGTTTASSGSGNQGWIAELASTASGNWGVLASSTPAYSDTTTLSKSTGTTGAATAAGLAIAMATMDSVAEGITDSWSNSYTEIDYPYNGPALGPAGLFLASKQIASGATTETTFTYSGTADQIHAAVVVFGKVAAVSPPVASAGADATVVVNTAFTRTGSGTNSPTSYAWTIQAGPAGVGNTIGTAAALNWTPTTTGTYTLRFAATNAGGTGTDDVIVTVNPAAPVASAGADATVTVNTAFTRTGSATNSPTSYAWTVVSGPANVGNTIGTAAALNWTPTTVGTYVLRLTATNVTGSGTDDLTLTVNPPAPVASAGADATIDNATTFSRTGSGTNTPTSYAWTIVSGPTGVTAGTNIGNAAALSYTPTIAGTYVLRLTATNAGGSGTDDLTLTVNALANLSTLTDTFGTIDTGKWGQYNEAQQSIVNGRLNVVPTSAYSDINSIANYNLLGSSIFVEVPTVPNVADGTTQAYFSLRNALDNSVKVEITWINNNIIAQYGNGTQITVVAYNATNHRFWRIRETGGTIYFDVSADSNNWNNIATLALTTYAAFTPGAVEVAIGAGFYGTAPTPGVAQFDNLNTVISPPVASAGADANLTLGQTFSRTGSGTNSPTGYAWTIVSGPAGVTPGTNIGNAAALSYQPTIVGTYVIRLTATNIGGSGTDDLTLTVSYDTPTTSVGADAGIDLGATFTRTATEDAKTAPVTSRQWSIVSGPVGVTTGNISGQTAAALSYTPTIAGTYVLRYTFVTSGGSATDDLQLVVTHQPPTANAGVDGSTLVNQAFTRTGTDSGYAITARAWTIQGGPTGVGSTIGTAAALNWTPTQPGVYTLRYSVTNAAGTVFDEMILTVNGPPVVEIGANINVNNRVNVSRNATETGGGGVTAREWKITAGPQINTVIGNTSLLDWTPTLPGTYTIQYSATNPFGTGTDTLTVTVAAIVIQVASTSSSFSSIVSPNLARRARITVAGTSIGVSGLASVPLKRVRLVAGTKAAVSAFTVGKPRNVTTHSRTITANSPVITAALATRRTFKETVLRQAAASATGKAKVVTRLSGTATQTTATISGTISSARKLAGVSTAVSALSQAILRKAPQLSRTISAQSSASLHAELVTRLSKTISGAAVVRNANLGVQQQGAATASAVSTATGTIITVSRYAKTATATSSITRVLNKAQVLLQTATATASTSRKLNSTIRENETIQAGIETSAQLGVAVLLIYEGMVARGVIYMEESAGILRQLSGQARAISQLPQTRLNRATKHSRTININTTITSLLRRIYLMSGSSTAYNFVGETNLVRLRYMLANPMNAVSSVAQTEVNRTAVLFRRALATASTISRLNGLFRFKPLIIQARSRLQERSGYAALTTAKAVTTSPQNRSLYVKKMAGYVTALVGTTGDLVVALPRVGYAEARATVTGNLVRVDPIAETVAVDARATVDEKGVGKLSTVIRIFENEELDAYINQENYTGTNIVALQAPRPLVFTRTFTRPR